MESRPIHPLAVLCRRQGYVACVSELKLGWPLRFTAERHEETHAEASQSLSWACRLGSRSIQRVCLQEVHKLLGLGSMPYKCGMQACRPHTRCEAVIEWRMAEDWGVGTLLFRPQLLRITSCHCIQDRVTHYRLSPASIYLVREPIHGH